MFVATGVGFPCRLFFRHGGFLGVGGFRKGFLFFLSFFVLLGLWWLVSMSQSDRAECRLWWPMSMSQFDRAECRLWWPMSMSQFDRVECRLWWLGSRSQSDQLKSSEFRLMSQSNRLVLLDVGFVVMLCGFWARFTYKHGQFSSLY